MRKLMTIAMMVAAMAAFSQMQITKNKVLGGAAFGYLMTTVEDAAGDDVTDATTAFQIPAVDYLLEAKPNDMFKLYLYGGIGYYMAKNTVDGDTPPNGDCYASDLSFYLNPMAKGYFANNLFAKLALPYNYDSVTGQDEDADALAESSLDFVLSGGFDNREIEMHGLTPWDKFEKGMAFYAVYDMGVMGSFDYIDPVTGDTETEDDPELPSYFGVEGFYAHMMDGNMMLKPYLTYKMGMNEDADPDSYMNIGVEFAKDFNEQMNLEAGLNFGMWMLDDADAVGSDEDSYNYLDVDAQFNYYVMPELDVYGALGVAMDLTTEDDNPNYLFGLGAVYTMNLLK